MQSAVTLGLSATSVPVTGNYWVVDVVRAGYFSATSSGNTINYLRVDMRVTYLNAIGYGSRVFFLVPGSIVVSSPHAQYQFDSDDTTLNLQDRSFDMGYTFTGYWIFQVQGNLDPLSTLQLTFTGGLSSGDTWLFQL